MASKVPKFGAWEGGENYTVYFDNARKNKNNGTMINPNDPEQSLDILPHNEAPAHAPTTHRRAESEEQQFKVPQFGSWDNGDNVGYTVYFENARRTKNGGPSNSDNEPHLNLDKNQGTVKPEPQEARSKVPQFGAWDGDQENVAYTAYFDNARKNRAEPVEPQLNRDVGERTRPPSSATTKAKSEEYMGQGGVRSRSEQSRGSTVSMPGSETQLKQGRQTPGGQSPLHPRGGKPQSKSGGRGNQTPEKSATIPQFGVWNKDPAQAEGFTGAFIRAREDRMTPLNNNTPASHSHQTQHSNKEEKKGCCFSCFG